MQEWPRKCRLCGEEFNSENTFINHLKKRHISHLTFIEQQKRFKGSSKEKEVNDGADIS